MSWLSVSRLKINDFLMLKLDSDLKNPRPYRIKSIIRNGRELIVTLVYGWVFVPSKKTKNIKVYNSSQINELFVKYPKEFDIEKTISTNKIIFK